MCWDSENCCNPKQFFKDFDCQTEDTKDGVIIKIKTKDKEKVETLKKMMAVKKGFCCHK